MNLKQMLKNFLTPQKSGEKNQFSEYFVALCRSKGIETAGQLAKKLAARRDVQSTAKSLERSCHFWFQGKNAPGKRISEKLILELRLSDHEKKDFYAHLKENYQKPDTSVEQSRTVTFLAIPFVIALFLLIVVVASNVWVRQLESVDRCRIFDDSKLLDSLSALREDQLDQVFVDCSKAASVDDALGFPYYVMGRIALHDSNESGNYVEPMHLFEEGIRRGNLDSAFELGNVWEDSLVGSDFFDVDRFRTAAKYYEYAALRGHSGAQFCYAISILFNRIIVDDLRSVVLENLEDASDHVPGASLLLDELFDPKIRYTVSPECSSRYRSFSRSQPMDSFKHMFINTR